MAGIATSFPFKPLPTRTTKLVPLLLSSLESKLFELHFRYPNSFSSSSLHCSASITTRFAGDSRFSGPVRSKQKDEDQDLDLSGIGSDSVRLIDEQQNMVGIVSKSQAIQMAEDAELDLVILSPDADPPVVRIMDYNRSHGFEGAENGVKVIVTLKGRENEFRNMAMELIRRFQNDVGELATEESKNFKDRNIFIVLVPNKVLLQKAQDPGKKKDKPTKDEVSAGV
ncbi:translation initiation factor IF3-4, chloroplastic-like isoform X2 [Durio zibethinus]|uniref:Translation initiation factor IF3-4, chloroplastic-like isoform X2 n=1 Tax=Durio zibethinus TaxID=66656 RepID=A0A6P5ZS25_DURZI|nr:translation initiation factor IF3-4, chloroplastic-like isoform X2 [Durio zibethinus]